MKKTALILAIILCLTLLCSCDNGAEADNKANDAPVVTANYEYRENDLYARFMGNGGSEIAELPSGKFALCDDMLFACYKITVGQKLTAPAGEPTKAGFKFAGWAEDAEGSKLWDFDKPVESGVTLFAKWERDEADKTEEYVEPKLAFTEKKDESAPFILDGVLNEPVSGDALKSVDLTRAAINVLTENADDVREYLNYTVDGKTRIVSATFASGKITVVYNDGTGDKTLTVSVIDVTESLKVDTNYETKAVKYENNVHIAPYNVIMAGSSSMENWTTSVEDMKPVTTANVGIGGTTVEQWTEKLARRLIYPYSPRAVVFYVGINNIINANKSGAQTGDALVELFEDVHSHLPEAHIYFILINKVPGYTSYYNDIDVANGMVETYSANKDFMTLIDAGSGLIKKSGKTNSAYFLTDGLHMSLCGYVIWGGAVKENFIATEKELYK